MTSPLPFSVDVVICGAGPVGATLANLLGRQGLRTLIIDKATAIFRAPRAIALDNEALRILQMAGLEDGSFAQVAIPRVRMHSPLFGQFACARTQGVTDGHPNLVTFFQPELEKVLRDRLAHYPTITLATGVELVDFDQRSDGVSVRLRAADGTKVTVQAAFLVGADGAGSTVRQQLGIAFDGKTFTQDWLVVDAKRVPAPIDDVEFLCDPRRPGPHMIAPGDRQRWEFMLLPGETREEMEHPDKVRDLLRPWTRDSEIEVERVAVYRFHARIAERFTLGRVFLVGDAAHITPPFAGQGLVAGLRDVANLSWKLAWVAKGWASAAILDSYDQERRPHARTMINFARHMGRLIMPRNRLMAFLIHGAMLLARQMPILGRAIDELEVKPMHRFKQGLRIPGSGSRHLHRGGLLPQGWLRPVGGGPAVLGDDAVDGAMVLLGFGADPATRLNPQQRARWQAFGGRIVTIVPRGGAGTAPADAWEDISGLLVPRTASGWAAIVRPDRMIVTDGPIDQAGDLIDQTLDLCGATGAVRSTPPAIQAVA